MKITISPALIEALVAMEDAELATLFRRLVQQATAHQKEISMKRSEAGKKGNMKRWHGDMLVEETNNRKQSQKSQKENEEEKEKNQKNKEEEKEPVVDTHASTTPPPPPSFFLSISQSSSTSQPLTSQPSSTSKENNPQPEWLMFWQRLRSDNDIAMQMSDGHRLGKEDQRKYLGVWHYFLKNNKADKHWTGGYDDFKQNFWHWMRMDCNSPSKIRDKYDVIHAEAEAQRRRARELQREEEERLRREQEWEEQKRRAVPCPSEIRRRLNLDMEIPGQNLKPQINPNYRRGAAETICEN